MYENIVYETDRKPAPEEIVEFYARTSHPTCVEPQRIARLIDESFCFITARRDGEVIGIARGVTDGVVGRLVECKLDPAYQGPACITRKDGRVEHDAAGIARQMALHVIEALRNYGAERIDVTAYGTEVDFCEELGFQRLPGMVAMGLPLVEAGQTPAVAVAAQAS
ncbi:MAG: GNAT family N-acetyltransferase [Phycisphaerales bacterium]|nr:MAG: GNAT family N-acetyltransferase [Phycisphaerales bacterium]